MGGSVMNKKDPKTWTDADFRAEIDKMAEALTPANDLVTYLAKNAPESVQFRKVFPLGLIGIAEPERIIQITRRPWITMAPTHLVVSEETAKSFELCDILYGNALAMAGDGEIPLDTFSVKYLTDADKRVSIVQQWEAYVLTPANKFSVIVKNLTQETKTFRGVMWCRVEG